MDGKSTAYLSESITADGQSKTGNSKSAIAACESNTRGVESIRPVGKTMACISESRVSERQYTIAQG